MQPALVATDSSALGSATPAHSRQPAAPRGWQPILDGILADRATSAWRRIVKDITRRSAEFQLDASLAGGAMGIAVPFAYAAQAAALPDAESQAVEWLERGMHASQHTRGGLSLYGGLAGVGWTIAHLTGGEESADDANFSALDAALRYQLDVAPFDHLMPYDVVSGIVGWGAYALQRLPSPTARELLELAIARLAALSVAQPDGVAWLTPAATLPGNQRSQFPEGYFNLGVAHGVAGVVGLLAAAISRGVAVDAATRLLGQATSYLLAQQNSADALGAYDYYVAPGQRGASVSRLAWCYGDLGNAVVVARAAAATGNGAWRRAAHELALRAARRGAATTGVEDAGLCHGAAGLAHLFNRLYQHFADDELRAAAIGWFARTLAFEGRGGGVGGFAAWQHGLPSGPAWTDDPGLLEGASGVALAFLAATTDVEPAWDAMLLADLPVAL
ncbi:MAG: lanthionine synthetase C family protein [Pirellulales bacterium]|nr:lanthionine synthetase C family protein [Pirellulales bacterium]